MKPNLLRSAIAAALYGGISFIPLAAHAQDQAAAPTDARTLDRVEVTGSRIRQVNTETTQPVQVVTRADIEKTGLNNVFDLLNNLTSSDGSGLSTVTTQTNGSNGSQQVSLRNLTAQRTLILVDGHRWTTDIDQVVDLSTIPLAIIERIEVLKDGASAIYGSDAIAGVINIITRKSYEGAQVGAYFGQTEKGDGDRSAFDATIGANGERSSGLLSLSYSHQDEIFGADRTITSEPVFRCGAACGSGSGAYGNFRMTAAQATALGLPLKINPANGLPFANQDYALTPGQDGQDVGDYHTFGNADRFNYAPVNYLQQPQTKQAIFASGRFDITDNVSAYARASYTKRTSAQQLAQVPNLVDLSGVAGGPQWAFPVTAGNIFNPFGVDLSRALFRNVAVGPRHNNWDINNWYAQLGLEGNFQIGDRYFNWDLAAAHSDLRYEKIGLNYINLFNLKNALGDSFRDGAGLHCGTPGNVIAGCVPFNVFGGPDLGLGAGVISQAEYDAMINYVSYTEVAATGNTTTNYSGNLSGDLFELPGGMMGFAIGFEYRKDVAFNQPDALVASGGSSDNFTEPTKGQTEVTDYFLELVAPLLKDLPMAKELELSAAVRKSDYSASGQIGDAHIDANPGKPTNAKYGLKWKPIEDLLVRASWGQTFRAPSTFDLYAGGAENFPAALDPCRGATAVAPATSPYVNGNPVAIANCTAAGVPVGGAAQGNLQIRGLGGGNPFLKPEHGTNFSAGLVYSPSWLDGLDLTLDYWRVNLKDALSVLAPQFILNQCFLDPNGYNASSEFCSKVERTPTGEIALVRVAQFNADSFRIAGIDLGVGYRLDSDSLGRFRFKLDATFVTKNQFNGIDLRGAYNGTPNWNRRGQLDVAWNRGDWDANWTMRYTSDVKENCFTWCNQHDGDGFNHSGGVVYHDVQVGWKAPWKAHLTVGARNVFGKEPPIFTNNTFAQSFDAAYDIPGGAFWYAQYRQDF